MSEESSEEVSRDWAVLYDRIRAELGRFGKIDAFGKADYWVVDDDWGWFVHQVELNDLKKMLRPEVLHALQDVLADYHDWLIAVRIDVPDKRDIWPGMGLFVRSDEIIDELRRDVLPPEFSEMTFARRRK